MTEAQKIGRIMIDHVRPYLKKHKKKLSETRLTPELLVRYVRLIYWKDSHGSAESS